MDRPHPNPDFPVTHAQAVARLRALAPKPLPRPVVILAGWHAPGLTRTNLERLLRPATSDRREDFLSLAYPFATSVESAAEHVARRVRARFAHAWPESFDLVGVSMGGLVARFLAAHDPDLSPRVRRIFTLASPHRGARLADVVRPDRAARQLRRGSQLLRSLDDSLARARFELVPYTMLDDWWVGATRSAPPGRNPIWRRPRTLTERTMSHLLIPRSRPIVLDLALRLRGEEPVAREGRPPPHD